jgi:hypothetical protein
MKVAPLRAKFSAMSVGELDRLLFSGGKAPAAEEFVAAVAAEQLWPGLGRSRDVGRYLSSVGGDGADLVASSLLILLHRNPSALDGVRWRPHAAELLAKRLDDLQPHAVMPTEKGAHAVFVACAPVVASVEADFATQVKSFTDLKQASTLRNAILRRLNGRAGRVVLRPFVPRQVIDAPLAELFRAAEALSLDECEPDAAFATLGEMLSAVQQAVESVGTHFARSTAGAVASAISAVATRRVELTRPPARVVASVDPRPLPLREPGVTCDIVLHVENVSDVGATAVTVMLAADPAIIVAPADSMRIEALRAHSAVPASIPITVVEGVDHLDFDVHVNWRNPDYSSGSGVIKAVVPAQPGGIDWAAVASLQPFAPYPVEDAAALVGRAQLLAQLELQFSSSPLGNIYVTGQRRVGKTSLVRVLCQQLRQSNQNLVLASVEMGEVRQERGAETISALGSALARKIIGAAGASGAVDVPTFSGSGAEPDRQG